MPETPPAAPVFLKAQDVPGSLVPQRAVAFIFVHRGKIAMRLMAYIIAQPK